MRDVIYDGSILRLVKLDRYWEIVEKPRAVAVLIVDGVRVLGVEQLRPAVDVATWELPAGLIDDGETPEQAALRELAEEVRLAGRLELLTQIHTSPGYSDELVFLFRAFDPTPAHAERDPHEELAVRWRDAREAWAGVRSGELRTSAVTAIGLSLVLAGGNGVR